MREKRTWTTIRILEVRMLQLKAEAELSGRSAAEVLDEILGLHETELALALEAMQDKTVDDIARDSGVS